MGAHDLLPVPAIALGPGRAAMLGDEVRSLPGAPRRVLLVADPGFRALGLLEGIERALHQAGLPAAVFERFGSDPSGLDMDGAAAAARAFSAEVVVGVGGGSALDVAKTAAAIAPADRSVEHYQFAGAPLPVRRLHSVLVPTTAGTGSETTWTAVFTNRAGRKAWLWGETLAATRAVLDPELTTALPPSLTATTGIDALVHAIEACTNTRRFPANDMYCHQAIALIVRHLPRAVAAPGDMEARAAMLLGACLAGIGINNCGTAIAHNIAHALGSLGHIHHGRAAGLGMRATLAWNVAGGNPAYAAVARAMDLPDAQALPAAFDRLLRDCGVPVAVADELPGVDTRRLAAEMALPENATMRSANARPVTDEDLLGFARSVLQAQ